jgi:bifunctional ADP-heptose synthase (sugar kinase/adenylyltransferase)
MDKKTTAIISGSIDLTAIDKSKLVEGKNGKKYLNITLMVQNQSQYGNNVWVTQTLSKEERENKAQSITLGNAAVRWLSEEGVTVAERNEVTNSQQNEAREEVDLPF